MMEIYNQSHQIVMLQVISSEPLNSNILTSKIGARTMYNAFHEFVKEWKSLEKAFKNKMNLIKQKIELWQNYWYHKYKIKSSLKLIKREIAERTLLFNNEELKEETGWILVCIHFSLKFL